MVKKDHAGKEETSTQQPSGITGRRRKKKELRSAATILFPGFRFVNAPPRTETPTRPDSFFSNNNTNRTHHPWWRHKEEDGKEKEQEKGGERSSSSNNNNNSNNSVVVVVQEKKNDARCAMRLPMEPKKIVAPRIKMFLPSFSGRTKTCPDLMKYSLEMNANVRVSKPIEMCDHGDGNTEDAKKRKKNRGDDANDVLTGVLKGKPVVCIAFENMHISVQKPVKFDVV